MINVIIASLMLLLFVIIVKYVYTVGYINGEAATVQKLEKDVDALIRSVHQ